MGLFNFKKKTDKSSPSVTPSKAKPSPLVKEKIQAVVEMVDMLFEFHEEYLDSLEIYSRADEVYAYQVFYTRMLKTIFKEIDVDNTYVYSALVYRHGDISKKQQDLLIRTYLHYDQLYSYGESNLTIHELIQLFVYAVEKDYNSSRPDNARVDAMVEAIKHSLQEFKKVIPE